MLFGIAFIVDSQQTIGTRSFFLSFFHVYFHQNPFLLNVLFYYTSYFVYHKYISLIGQWAKIRTRDHTGQKSYSMKQKSHSTPSKASWVLLPELLFFDRKTSESLGTHHLQATIVGVVFKCLRQRSNGLKICLPAVFYMYVFSWFHSV
jgi:hypothetical protein